ncbi:multidrug MFS transporter [Candidatus Magnetoovum chiemensis]|nr:multidrug MFS transporter [Candidatus Magnetoovum chiemensis]
MYIYLKAIIDITVSFILLVILSPIFLFIAFLIKIDSNGSVFYTQRRCGKGGREFNIVKFRTMVSNADDIKHELENEVEGSVFKVMDDPRITRVGKFLRAWSMDELPQLINVIKGDMSLVGPRPLSKEELTGNEQWMTTRLSVPQGLTGLWQISARNSGKFNDWIKYDSEYVKKRSLFYDLAIIFKTIKVVLQKKGV